MRASKYSASWLGYTASSRMGRSGAVASSRNRPSALSYPAMGAFALHMRPAISWAGALNNHRPSVSPARLAKASASVFRSSNSAALAASLRLGAATRSISWMCSAGSLPSLALARRYT